MQKPTEKPLKVFSGGRKHLVGLHAQMEVKLCACSLTAARAVTYCGSRSCIFISHDSQCLSSLRPTFGHKVESFPGSSPEGAQVQD